MRRSNSRGVRLTSRGKRASSGDGFFGDLTKEGERLLFNLQPPRYQPLLTLYPQIIAPLRPWPYAPNAGSILPRSKYSDRWVFYFVSTLPHLRNCFIFYSIICFTEADNDRTYICCNILNLCCTHNHYTVIILQI